MTRIDDLHYMPEFVKTKGKVIYPNEESYDNVISEWATLLQRQCRKRLIPLFITGSGVSVPLVPTVFNIIDKLQEFYNEKNNKESLGTLNKDSEELFKMLHDLSERGKKDRSIIARLLNSFQENNDLKNEWQKLNEWLLDQILKASPTPFHQGLADIYNELNAVCLTLNFDGLLIRQFVQYRSMAGHHERAFSLPTMEECEQFFLRTSNPSEKGTQREFLEVQIRGDILYVECNAAGYCPQKGKGKERSIWASIASYSNESSGSSDFFDEEFRAPLTIESLCEAINGDEYKRLPLPYEATIKWLNSVLEVADLYDQIKEKKLDLNMPESVNKLVEETEQYRKENSSELRKEQQSAIKNLNRMCLEAVYPQETPKSRKTTISTQGLLKCPSCGNQGISFLSFPGSYKKEKDMQNMLSIIWRFLAFRVGSVTVVGMSGEWDPLIVAFLGDLLSEREIPLLVVDNKPEAIRKKGEYTYIIRELVKPGTHYAVAVGENADSFMKVLKKRLAEGCLPTCDAEIKFNRQATDDSYWYQKMKTTDTSGVADVEEKAKLERLRKSINLEFSSFEDHLIIDKLKLSEQLNKFAQLGLKSYWIGIKSGDAKYHNKYHNRYNHSIGVMKIASYLYDRAIANLGLKENLCEKQFLRLAALLHDIGHLPFSHLIEVVFKELNWKPAGYRESYSHVLQTNDKILEIFENEDSRKKLESLNYTVKDLINLVNGCFGVGYLDAIINSPVDADKIDYVFRDTESTGRRISLSPIQFLKDITNGLTITSESYLAFSGVSAIAAQQLLETRQHLYQNLYLQPGILILEGIVKLIIKTYFVHFLNLKDDKLLGDITYDRKDYPDLGDYKIRYSINALNNLLTEATLQNDENIELTIVKLMFKKIEERRNMLNDSFNKGLAQGFETIKNIDNEDKLKALEASIIYKRLKGQRKVIAEIIRDVGLRMPGAAIIELRKLPEYLSAADKRKEIDRSDGTKTFAECILVPDGSSDTWTPTSKAAKAINDPSFGISSPEEHAIYIYPLLGNLDDSYFRQTDNLLDKMLDKKGVISFSHA